MLTVAIPAYEARLIWLPLEGLARQVDAPPWRLICHEDGSERSGSVVDLYAERLALAGCRSITYEHRGAHQPLSIRWAGLVEAAGPRGVLVLQDADDYPDPRRLRRAVTELERATWAQSQRGYFYDLALRRIALYDWDTPGFSSVLGVGFAGRLEAIYPLPDWELSRNVIGWIYDTARRRTPDFRVSWDVSRDYRRGVYTDGANTVSPHRRAAISQERGPYRLLPKHVLADVLPPEVAERLEAWPCNG